ncbi:hypothetical protein [Anaerofustis sp. NSJ-163]|nr:hypothetical protein [Anaerofustis sp. NSJ-163]MCO8194688.1 hypothetical protein [Anaerofustis sp. NSJ-163]
MNFLTGALTTLIRTSSTASVYLPSASRLFRSALRAFRIILRSLSSIAM